MGRHTCCVKQKLRKGLWSPEEDEKLYNYITRNGVGCWSSVPKQAGLQRCGKSCRLRWINYLRPDLKRGMFSQQEEELIINLHKVLGNRWAQIAAQLPGRTDNEIKNLWNSSLKKKLMKQGIDPKTHKQQPRHGQNSTSVATAAAAGAENSSANTDSSQRQSTYNQEQDPATSLVTPTTTTAIKTEFSPTSYYYNNSTDIGLIQSAGQGFFSKPVFDTTSISTSSNSSAFDYFQPGFDNFLINNCSSSSILLDQYHHHQNFDHQTACYQQEEGGGFAAIMASASNCDDQLNLPNLITATGHLGETDFSDSCSTQGGGISSNSFLFNEVKESSTGSTTWENKLEYSAHDHHGDGIKTEEDFLDHKLISHPWQLFQQQHQIHYGDGPDGDQFISGPMKSFSEDLVDGVNIDIFQHM